MTFRHIILLTLVVTGCFAASAWALDEGRAVADALRVLFS